MEFTQKIWLGIILLFCQFASTGQTLKGTILDNRNLDPLSGVHILAYQNEDSTGTVSDTDGFFYFQNLKPGIISIKIQSLGYQTIFLPEIYIQTGKENFIEVLLVESSLDLEEVTVKASSRIVNPLNQYTITVEETERFPATFNDPGRLIAMLPGVINDNDQTNNMSIRGHSPNFLKWQIEGAEIVNPNHLSNAGTFSDRSSQSGGGVNILSAHMLTSSTFNYGDFGVDKGNALGGIMDMKFRSGNSDKYEFTGQAGLLGLDLAAEGPLAKDGSTFIANYRYSTIGLLGALGLDFGDEQISFQDISFKFDFAKQDDFSLNIYGLGGISKNKFIHKSTEDIEEYKDLFDINFDSKMGALGATAYLKLNERSFWKSTFIWSALDNKREASIFDQSEFDENDEQFISKVSFVAENNFQIEEGSYIVSGFNLGYTEIEANGSFRTKSNYKNNWVSILLTPYAYWDKTMNSGLNWNIGLRFPYYNQTDHFALQPRFSVNLPLKNRDHIGIGYGIYSQVVPDHALIQSKSNIDKLDPIQAHKMYAGYSKHVDRFTLIKAELYFHSLYKVPISDRETDGYSLINDLDLVQNNQLVSKGKARNIGLDMMLQRHFSNDLFYLASASVFSAKYTGSDGIWRSSRYNGGYSLNFTSGKEWVKKIRGEDFILGINGRLALHGGFKDSPIDVSLSRQELRTFYQNDQLFTLNQKNYYKIDARVYLKRNKDKYSSILALDIQNLSSHKNEAYRYFDPHLDQITTKKQLGIIPNLSYRIHW